MVIGFDAMDRDLAARLADEGVMPNLRRLLLGSQQAEVNNPVGFVVGGVWPTFWSGRLPARHGRHCYVQLTPGTYDFEPVTPWGIDGVPYWSAVGASGRRICNVDVPFTVPIEGLDGVQIIDWGSHDRRIPFVATPAAAMDRIETLFGPHPVQPKCDDMVRAGLWGELRDALVEGAARRTEIVLDAIARTDAELISVVYGESHCAGHQFWKVHDPEYVDHDPSLRASLGDPLVDVYASLDRQLGTLLDAVPDALVYVLLSHGMGPHHDGDHLLPEVLRRLDDVRSGGAIRSEWPRRMRHRLIAVVRPFVSHRRRQRRFERRKTAVRAQRHAERARRRFFHHPNNTMFSGVRINLAGREPDGQVSRDERSEILGWLQSELSALVDPETGHEVVDGVYIVRDLYEGPHLDELPDLVVDWNRDRPIAKVASATIGSVVGRYASTRTGDHRLDGLLAVTGPGSERIDLTGSVRLQDLAPTIAAHFGLVLDDVDGRPIEGMADPLVN